MIFVARSVGNNRTLLKVSAESDKVQRIALSNDLIQQAAAIIDGKDYSKRMSTEVMSTCKIGVTGTIGSGKSLVGRILSEQNIPVLDVDDVVHGLLDSSKEVQSAIASRFGDDVLIADDHVEHVLTEADSARSYFKTKVTDAI